MLHLSLPQFPQPDDGAEGAAGGERSGFSPRIVLALRSNPTREAKEDGTLTFGYFPRKYTFQSAKESDAEAQAAG